MGIRCRLLRYSKHSRQPNLDFFASPYTSVHSPHGYSFFRRPSRGLQRDPYLAILSDSDSEEEHYEMVQAYHAVPVTVEHEDADNGPGIEHEGSALLGSTASSSRIAKSKAQKDGHATLTSSIGNLANTILGSGELRSVPPLVLPISIISTLSCPYLSAYHGLILPLRWFRHAHLPTGTFRPTLVIHVP